jgi:hypothetical protein
LASNGTRAFRKYLARMAQVRITTSGSFQYVCKNVLINVTIESWVNG